MYEWWRLTIRALTTRDVISGRLYVFVDEPAGAAMMSADGRREGRSWGDFVAMYESNLGLMPLSLRAAM